MSIGARLHLNLNGLFPFGGVPDIGAKVGGQFVWPGGSYKLGSFGAKVSNGGLTIYLPNPIPTICIKIKALSVSKGACQ
ncbi:MAG: hypothetical protein IV100_07595 [Myxococcales bacterium]|nr:hypothetical protein [Myxococcales bacterium]